MKETDECDNNGKGFSLNPTHLDQHRPAAQHGDRRQGNGLLLDESDAAHARMLLDGVMRVCAHQLQRI